MHEKLVELSGAMEDEYMDQTVADMLAMHRKYLTEEYERKIAAIEEFAKQNPELLFKKRKEFEVLRYIL
jgi:hypothetical protein